MPHTNLADCIGLLKEQAKALDTQADEHSKAWSLLELALAENVLEQPKSTIYGLLWNLSDLVAEAKKINEVLLDTTLKLMAKLSQKEKNRLVEPNNSNTKH